MFQKLGRNLIVLLYKRGKESKLSNYSPVNLTLILSKIMKSLISNLNSKELKRIM